MGTSFLVAWNRSSTGLVRRLGMRWRFALCGLALVAMHFPTLALGQEDEKPAKPQEIVFKTNDDVALTATYYPSKRGKDAVPVVLLHESKGNRGDFKELALVLQRAGQAVIACDLRGHGDSLRQQSRAAELRPAEYPAMVSEDMEAVKRFLITKNNAEELNVEKLCLVGVEMGAAVALNWAAMDWSWPVLNTGKQGQDVKALVLVSPEWTFKGLKIADAIAEPHIQRDLSIMIIVGGGSSKALHEAKRLYAAFERHHPPVPAGSAAEKQTLWLRAPQTSLQGKRLLNEKSLHIDEMIAKFIEVRLTKKQYPWSFRKGVLQ